MDELFLQLSGGQPLVPLTMPQGELVDQTGRPFRMADDARGHITLLFFGYTYCPDVCPLETARLADVQKAFSDTRRIDRAKFQDDSVGRSKAVGTISAPEAKSSLGNQLAGSPTKYPRILIRAPNCAVSAGTRNKSPSKIRKPNGSRRK